jgi:hypothetical protein
MEKRTMIIVWSWASKGQGEGNWSVDGPSYAGDLVVCRDLQAGPESVETLRALIDTYQSDGEVMVFLHRQHGYHGEHLEALLSGGSTDSIVRCFLFGEGAGPIYLTRHARGLLGSSGTFSARVVLDGQDVVLTAVADANKQSLKPNHFEFVWQRYGLALYERTAELKEDFFSALGQEAEASMTFAAGALYQLLNQPRHRQLLLRLLSFVGRVRKHSDLAQEISTFERTAYRTLAFERYSAQLAATAPASALAAYRQLSEYLLRQVLSKGEAVSLPLLRDKFDQLLLLLKD